MEHYVYTRLTIPIFTVIFTVMYASVATLFFSKMRSRRKERKERLWNALNHGFMSKTITTVEDVVNVYKGVHNLSGEDETYRSDLCKYLREYLVAVLSDKESKSYSVKERMGQITSVINAVEKAVPYSEVPTAERNLLLDIDKLIDHGDANSAKNKLTDLAGLIQVRSDQQKSLEASNKWSVPLAAIGLILTIIFGIYSLETVN